MAAKLIRQPGQLVVVGAPTSSAAAAAGAERAPGILRELGILARLESAGYRVNDAGDLPARTFESDPENPRARNLPAILQVLDALRLRIEQAARTRALPLVLGGDASIQVGLVAGLRRQAPSLGLIHLSRYADLHTPADTGDGLVGPMTVSHLIGQGAAEMIRFWKNPPLVREPDLVAFGLDETDAIDIARRKSVAIREFPLARIRKLGARAAAEAAVEHFRGEGRDYVVHLSWDIFSPQEVPGCARGLADGLSAAEAGEILRAFAASDRFAALSISGYDPDLDPERAGARVVVSLVADALAARLAALLHPEREEEEEKPAPAQAAAAPSAGPSDAPSAAPADARAAAISEPEPAISVPDPPGPSETENA